MNIKLKGDPDLLARIIVSAIDCYNTDSACGAGFRTALYTLLENSKELNSLIARADNYFWNDQTTTVSLEAVKLFLKQLGEKQNG